ncbi:MAG TPA: PorP/SprF family type IX secretion system membrane protein, partial [Bacteroidia bacterium]|nr:PorP/SprF family type IX secretion system membrane protein [Bacteroidia bacterium]
GDGSLRTNYFDMSIAYHARLDDYNAFSGGLIGGMIQSSISADALRWNLQYGPNGYDPNAPSGEILDRSRVSPDFGAGFLWTYGKQSRSMTSNDETNFHAGISIMHINRPDMSFLGTDDQMHPRITLHAAGMFQVTNTNLALCPSLLVMEQGKQNEITVGMLMKFEMKEAAKITGFIKGGSVLMGGYYRNKDAVAPYFGFEFASYAFGVSYDLNISGLKTVTNSRGGVEIMLRLQNPQAFLYQNKTKASID